MTWILYFENIYEFVTIYVYNWFIQFIINRYGHVHFDTEEQASRFFHVVKGCKFPGPRGGTVFFKPATLYNTKTPVQYKVLY